MCHCMYKHKHHMHARNVFIASSSKTSSLSSALTSFQYLHKYKFKIHQQSFAHVADSMALKGCMCLLKQRGWLISLVIPNYTLSQSHSRNQNFVFFIGAYINLCVSLFLIITTLHTQPKLKRTNLIFIQIPQVIP